MAPPSLKFSGPQWLSPQTLKCRLPPLMISKDRRRSNARLLNCLVCLIREIKTSQHPQRFQLLLHVPRTSRRVMCPLQLVSKEQLLLAQCGSKSNTTGSQGVYVACLLVKAGVYMAKGAAAHCPVGHLFPVQTLASVVYGFCLFTLHKPLTSKANVGPIEHFLFCWHCVRSIGGRCSSQVVVCGNQVLESPASRLL